MQCNVRSVRVPCAVMIDDDVSTIEWVMGDGRDGSDRFFIDNNTTRHIIACTLGSTN